MPHKRILIVDDEDDIREVATLIAKPFDPMNLAGEVAAIVGW